MASLIKLGFEREREKGGGEKKEYLRVERFLAWGKEIEKVKQSENLVRGMVMGEREKLNSCSVQFGRLRKLLRYLFGAVNNTKLKSIDIHIPFSLPQNICVFLSLKLLRNLREKET